MSDLIRTEAYLRKAAGNLREARLLVKASFPGGTANRAYYTLFDCILALLHTMDGPVPQTHTGAHTEFRKQFIKTGIFAETYSALISELFNLRQAGDYEVDFIISIDDAQAAVDQVAEFLATVQAYVDKLASS